MDKKIIIGIILVLLATGLTHAESNTPLQKPFTCMPFQTGSFTTNINQPFCVISNSSLQISNYSQNNIKKSFSTINNNKMYIYIFAYKGSALIKDIYGYTMNLKIINPVEQQMQTGLAVIIILC